MKTHKWIALVCGAYLPLLVVVLLILASSFHSRAAEPPRVLQPGTQSDPALPSAFAVTLFAPVEVNGQMLAPGEYIVDWSQEAGSASFAQAGVIQAIARGEVETRPEPARYSVVLTHPKASGVSAITVMQFEGKRSVLVLAPAEKVPFVTRAAT